MLTFNGLDANKNEAKLYFDNYTFKFYLDKDKKISVPNLQSFKHSQENKAVVVVPLGYRCTNRCVYCIQRKMADEEFDVSNFAQSVHRLKKDHDIWKIHFIGGEPLLEWDTVKEIIRLYPDLKYSMITNGVNLTPDIVDTLIEKKFTISISHDGESQLLHRGADILSYNHPAYKPLVKLCENTDVQISSVLCGTRASTFDRYIYFYNKQLKFKHIEINPVIPFKDNLNKLIVGKEDWMQYMLKLIEDIHAIHELNPSDTGNQSLIQDMFRLYCSEDTNYNLERTCCPIFNPNIVTISQSGSYKYCHNCDKDVSTDNTYELQRRSRYDKCRNCPILLVCTSGCRITDDSNFDAICNRAYYYKLAYLLYFMYNMFGFITTSIDGDFAYADNGTFVIAAKSAGPDDQ